MSAAQAFAESHTGPSLILIFGITRYLRGSSRRYRRHHEPAHDAHRVAVLVVTVEVLVVAVTVAVGVVVGVVVAVGVLVVAVGVGVGAVAVVVVVVGRLEGE